MRVESFQDYLTEAKSTELLAKVSKWFMEFNHTLFNNELPSIKLETENSKKRAGSYHSYTYTKKINGKSVVTGFEHISIKLSTFFEFSDENYKSILVHEMIHMWMREQGYNEGHDVKVHGKEFMAKLNALNKKVPFVITKSEDGANFVVAGSDKAEVGVWISIHNQIEHGVVLFTSKFYKTNHESLMKFAERHSGAEFFLGLSTNKDLHRFPIKRSLTKVAMYSITPEFYQNIRTELTQLKVKLP